MIRDRIRYIAVDTNPKVSNLQKAIQSALITTLGELGYAKLRIRYLDIEGKLTLRVKSQYLYDVLGAIALMKEIEGEWVEPKLLAVSGTIKKLTQKLNKQKQGDQ